MENELCPKREYCGLFQDGLCEDLEDYKGCITYQIFDKDLMEVEE